MFAGVVALGLLVAPVATWAADTVVFAAASLKNALDAAAKDYEAKTGHKIAISYAGSSALAKQIEQGAPADIFISADLDWMDYLAGKKLIADDTRRNLLGNTLVLVAPADSSVSIKIAPGFDLAKALGDGRLAMADPASVPAGKYGKAALEKLGVWDSVKDKVAQAENVRAALAFIAQGEAPLGIVYQTDATAEPKVKVVDTFPADTHPPIIYPVALTASSTSPDAKAFLDYLGSEEARKAFEGQGFQVLQ
ncbi:MAG TPA: molybdate ABC transporter substrate-binding protein [Hypericibacter adhaerens]|uniref:Molybdate ABC transporter substrate-binding protein n=1 Tax=Hypericibacter adhaerens TaxID=2602016 RepID=A0A5J6MXW2_9PROT|nr:molybdate ABC transporter substrate-binding protein [Hypericibacter adhaerens]QEX22582.1 molybdate ABC transporter substrate-binding protein [Hypericibacter adhaerens]HWA41902.1 molybdate ABC transporter substrate-binding protein [Hypericibacter adhaerens]